MPGSLEKARISKLTKSGHEETRFDVMFNPKELTLAKQNSWKSGNNTNTNVPALEFGGGQPSTLKMQLFFDTYEQTADVREHTDPILQLMIVDPALQDKKNKKGRPPTVRFQWGSFISFDAVITNISQRFTMFRSSGEPVRAVLDVTFQEAKDAHVQPKQNPTSGGVGGQRVWTVKEGDTLSFIAYSEYHDPTDWRRIADANGLTKVRELVSGTRLVIPHG